MKESKIMIKNNLTGEVIASGTRPLKIEGKFYFPLQDVNIDSLVLTDRTYTCTHKVVCYWIDLTTEKGTPENVAWIYLEPIRDIRSPRMGTYRIFYEVKDERNPIYSPKHR